MSQNDIMQNVSNNIDSVGSDSANLQKLLKIANSIASDNVRRKNGNTPQPSLMVDTVGDDLNDVIKSRGPKQVQRGIKNSQERTIQNSKEIVEPVKKVVTTGSDDNTLVTSDGKNENETNSHDAETNKTEASNVSSNMTTLMGFSLPTSTLYFIIACIIIAIILFYMTSPVSTKKEKSNDKKTEESNESDDN